MSIWQELSPSARLSIARENPRRAKELQAQSAIAEQENSAWKFLEKTHGKNVVDKARAALEAAKSEALEGGHS